MKKRIYNFLVKTCLKLHSFFYQLSGILAIKANGGSHPKHRLMNYHHFFVDNIKKGDIVLDIGCGNGALTFDLIKRAKFVFGIDLNKENIKLAKEKYSASNIKYIFGDAIRYNFDRKFDIIILSNVLEHIKNRKRFFKKIIKIAPKILIRVPMINRDWITLYKKELGIEWRLDPTHFTEYSLKSFKKELKQAGLKLEKYSIQFGEIWAIIK